ncbi:MAG: hypothetical protein ACI4WM_07080 [Erysipelotrichaceae bacterium]
MDDTKDKEILDELLENINGGRALTQAEGKVLFSEMQSAKKTLGEEEYKSYYNALCKYVKYIQSLPADAPEHIFNYDCYDGESYDPGRIN